MHHIRSFSSQQFFGSAVTLDPRHNVSHRSLSHIRGICDRDQPGASASQDCAGMVLGMSPGAE